VSELSEVRVNLAFRGRQLAEFLAIKEHLGIQTNADVVRYLVRRHARALQRRERTVTQRRRGAGAQRGDGELTQRRKGTEAQRGKDAEARRGAAGSVRTGGRTMPAQDEDVRVRPSELAHLCLDCPLPECDEGDPRCPYQRATGERERQRERTRAYMRRVRAK
jgi:hypothetical protein